MGESMNVHGRCACIVILSVFPHRSSDIYTRETTFVKKSTFAFYTVRQTGICSTVDTFCIQIEKNNYKRQQRVSRDKT